MPPPARHPGAAVARVGGQQLPEQAAARGEHPGADRPLGGLPARITAAQRPYRLRCQAAYLGGSLRRERAEEPPFPPSGAEAAAVAAAGLASQIFSFTSMICSTAAVNSACRDTSRRTLATSAAASWRPTVFRRPADRVHRNLGPCPG